MAFIGVGISHAALGGVALGLLLGVSPVAAAGVFSVAVAWVIGWITRRGEVSEDTAIGVFFPTAMALGVALISLSQTYRQDLLGYLFGNILSVGPGDILGLLVLAGISLGVLALFFKEFLFLGVDEEAAKAAGLPAAFLNYLLLSHSGRHHRCGHEAGGDRPGLGLPGHPGGHRARPWLRRSGEWWSSPWPRPSSRWGRPMALLDLGSPLGCVGGPLRRGPLLRRLPLGKPEVQGSVVHGPQEELPDGRS